MEHNDLSESKGTIIWQNAPAACAFCNNDDAEMNCENIVSLPCDLRKLPARPGNLLEPHQQNKSGFAWPAGFTSKFAMNATLHLPERESPGYHLTYIVTLLGYKI